jgi:uncharacterized oxidoreductase
LQECADSARVALILVLEASVIRITAERLHTVVREVFVGSAMPADNAQRVAESLVENNLAGHDSHGVLRVGYYIDALLSGRINPHGELAIVRQSATTDLLDGGCNLGQVTARRAMDLAMGKARVHDMGMVAVRNCGHIGRLGEYAVQAAQAGFMGLVFSSGSAKGGIAAP